MHVISKKRITDFCKVNRRKDAQAARAAFLAWYTEAKTARWTKWADIKARYRSADKLSNGRVVFNICGNNYRIVTRLKFSTEASGSRKTSEGRVWIRFIGTHKEYDKINAEEV